MGSIQIALFLLEGNQVALCLYFSLSFADQWLPQLVLFVA